MLLDELERLSTATAAAAVSAQIVEDLARLGCRCIELAAAMAPERAE